MATAEYAFGGRLSAAFPSQILVDATEICNLACIHCPHPEFKKSPHYSAAQLTVELNKKMVDEVATHGKGHTQYIRYTSNGEPLTHPHIYEMLDYAVQNSGVAVTLTTNGKVLNEDRVEKLLRAGLHLIDVSIDAHRDDTYKKIRVGGNLEVTRKNVLRLIEMKRQAGARSKVIVSFVEQPDNSDEVHDFKKFWEQNGADSVVIRRLHSSAGGVTSIANTLQMKSADQDRYPCLYPWERVILNPRGELAFCPQDWTHQSNLVDYRTTTIRETWQGQAYNDLRSAHTKNCFKGHEFCGNCPDWQQTRWPWMGRSYADLIQEVRQDLGL